MAGVDPGLSPGESNFQVAHGFPDPLLCSREMAGLLYSSSRVAKADGSELLRSFGSTSLQKVTLIPEQEWVDGRKCCLALSPPQGTQRTSILLGMFLDFTFSKGESGNNQDRMPVIVLAWWQHTAVLALFLYSSEKEDSGRWAACWQSAECPRSDFRTCPWSALQSYES